MGKICLILNRNNAQIAYLLQQNHKYMLLALTARKRMKKHLTLLYRNKVTKKYRRYWTTVENTKFWEEEVPLFDDDKFKNYLRVDRSNFNYLVDVLKGVRKQDSYWRYAIRLEKRIAVALFALSSSAEYKTVGSLFGVGRTTVREIVIAVCKEICRVQKVYITGYPPSDERILENVRGFEKLVFPQCYGAIDGSHIEVSPPKSEAAELQGDVMQYLKVQL